MSIQGQFHKFYGNIKLTETQKTDAKTKYNGVCKKLHDNYYPNMEYNGSTKLLIGSYGKHTNIRPPRDVDVLFIMPDDKFEQYDDNDSNDQSQLLQDIKKILSGKYTTTGKIKGWGKVVLIEFSDGTHNIELLPAWKNQNGSFTIPNSKNGGSWDNWDSKSEVEKIKQSNNKNNKKTIPIIRMIKKWSDNCTVNIKSFTIENKIIDFFNLYDSNREYSDIIKNVFNYLYNQILDETIKSHLKTAHERACKAFKYENSDNDEKATKEWKKIFGNDFPKGEDKKEFSQSEYSDITALQKDYPSPKEEYLDVDYGISFNINSNFKIKIDALVKQNGFRDKFLSECLSSNLPLAKQKVIIFKIINSNIPQPFSVKWKVRNFGDEAQIANDLRGEISDGSIRKEKTRYKGKHYVECYIIKNNCCVACDNILVPIK